MLKGSTAVLVAALVCSAEVALALELRPTRHQDTAHLPKVNAFAAAAPQQQPRPATPTDASASAQQPQESPPPLVSCPEVGIGYWKTSDYPVCLIIGGHVAGYGEHDIADKDLLVLPQYVDGMPSVVYEARKMPPSERLTRMRAEVLLYVGGAMPTPHGELRSYLSLEGRHDGRDSSLHVKEAYVALSRFTAGRHTSMFDFSTGFNDTEGYTSDKVTNLIAYRQPVGDRASVTFSLEDSHARRILEGVWAQPGGQELPDAVVVGEIRGTRGGRVQAAAALHHLKDGRMLGCCDTPGTRFGWAAQLGLEKPIQYGEQSGRFLLSGAYAVGAPSYLGILPYTSDYIVDADGQIAPTHGFSAIASYEHVWRPTLRSAVTVSGYRTTTEASGFRWESGGLIATVGSEYTLAQDFQLGAELSYYLDMVRGSTSDAPGERANADFVRVRTYFKRFF